METDLFINSTLSCSVSLPIIYVGSEIAKVLTEIISNTYEGKCCENGYIQQGSCKVLNYSAGKMDGANLSGEINYTVVFNAMLFTTPAVGTIITGKIENIVKAGLKLVSNKYTPTPFIAFIARDHDPNKLSKYKEGDVVKFKVRDSTFNIRDTLIYIIAELTA